MRGWLFAGFLIALGGVYVIAHHFIGGPKDIYGFVRYALPQWHRGGPGVGDRAPDVKLLSLDGGTKFYLRDWIGGRPLVLILGSYT